MMGFTKDIKDEIISEYFSRSESDSSDHSSSLKREETPVEVIKHQEKESHQ